MIAPKYHKELYIEVIGPRYGGYAISETSIGAALAANVKPNPMRKLGDKFSNFTCLKSHHDIPCTYEHSHRSGSSLNSNPPTHQESTEKYGRTDGWEPSNLDDVRWVTLEHRLIVVLAYAACLSKQAG